MRQSKMPKIAADWIRRNQEKIEHVDIEDDEFGGSSSPWSIWVYLFPGWICEDSETHAIHETTGARFIEAARTVKPCDCEECRRYLMRLGK